MRQPHVERGDYIEERKKWKVFPDFLYICYNILASLVYLHGCIETDD